MCASSIGVVCVCISVVCVHQCRVCASVLCVHISIGVACVCVCASVLYVCMSLLAAAQSQTSGGQVRDNQCAIPRPHRDIRAAWQPRHRWRQVRHDRRAPASLACQRHHGRRLQAVGTTVSHVGRGSRIMSFRLGVSNYVNGPFVGSLIRVQYCRCMHAL